MVNLILQSLQYFYSKILTRQLIFILQIYSVQYFPVYNIKIGLMTRKNREFQVSLQFMLKTFLVLCLLFNSYDSKKCEPLIQNTVESVIPIEKLAQPLPIQKLNQIFESLDHQSELSWKYPEYFSILNQYFQVEVENKNEQSQINQGKIFDVLGLLDMEDPQSHEIHLEFEDEQYFSSRKMTAEKIINLLCSMLAESDTEKLSISQLGSLRSLQTTSPKFIEEKILNDILKQINHVRKIRNQFYPLVRDTQVEEDFMNFFSQKQLSPTEYLAQLGYIRPFIEFESAPPQLIVPRTSFGCTFCYFKKTTKIGLVGILKKNGRLAEVYAILTQVTTSAFDRSNYIQSDSKQQTEVRRAPPLKSTNKPRDSPVQTKTQSENEVVKKNLNVQQNIELEVIDRSQQEKKSTQPKDSMNEEPPKEEIKQKQNEAEKTSNEKNFQEMKKDGETKTTPTPNNSTKEEEKKSMQENLVTPKVQDQSKTSSIPSNLNMFINQIPQEEEEKTPLKEQVSQKVPQPQPETPIEKMTSQFSNEPNKQINSKQVISNEFQGISLYHKVPETFLAGENYVFRGHVNKEVDPSSTTLVNVVFRNSNSGRRFFCTQYLPKGSVEFEFQCEIGQPGEYFLSIFDGPMGKSSRTKRKVENSMKKVDLMKGPSSPTGVELVFEDNMPILMWDSRYPLAKVVITQNNQKIEKMFSNFKNIIKFNIKEFGNFKPDQKAKIQIFQASSETGSAFTQNSEYSEPVTLQFTARQNHFAEQQPKKIQLQHLPWIVMPGTKLMIKGRALDHIMNDIMILTPSKQFLDFEIVKNGPQLLNPGTPINLQIDLKEEGAYILQINHKEGYAVVNRPIYVQKGVPIVPDFQARKDRITNITAVTEKQPPTLNGKRQLLLKLINELRGQYGVQPVYLDNELNVLAQRHAEDMARRNFYGHVNPEGEDPNDRAQKMGITTMVGENIAANPNITDVHYRLSRSNLHLINSVRPFWTRVGLGISKNRQGVFLVTQEFSSRDFRVDPLTNTENSKLHSQLIDMIIQSTEAEKENTALSKALRDYQNSSMQKSIMAFLRERGFQGTKLQNLIVPFHEQLIKMLKSGNYFKDSGGRKEVGATIKMIGNQMMEIFVAYI